MESLKDINDIDSLNISSRLKNVFKESGYSTIDDIQNLFETHKIFELRGIGLKSISLLAEQIDVFRGTKYVYHLSKLIIPEVIEEYKITENHIFFKIDIKDIPHKNESTAIVEYNESLYCKYQIFWSQKQNSFSDKLIISEVKEYRKKKGEII